MARGSAVTRRRRVVPAGLAVLGVPALVSACGGGPGRPAAARHAPPSVPVVTAPPSSAVSVPPAPPGAGTTSATTAAPTSTTTSPGVTAAAATVVDDCTGAPEVRPASIVLACGDGGIVAGRIAWSSWGSAGAAGTTTVTVNDCDPDCAEGHDHDYPATIGLGQVQARNGRPTFTVATLTYTGAVPPNQPRSDDYPLVAGAG